MVYPKSVLLITPPNDPRMYAAVIGGDWRFPVEFTQYCGQAGEAILAGGEFLAVVYVQGEASLHSCSERRLKKVCKGENKYGRKSPHPLIIIGERVKFIASPPVGQDQRVKDLLEAIIKQTAEGWPT